MTAQLLLERPFASGRLAVQLASRAWEFPFADFAHELVRVDGGTIETRLGSFGVDEAYWDVRIRGQLLTLHSQHYLGVFLCATTEESEETLKELLPFVAGYVSRSTTLWGRVCAALRTFRRRLATIRHPDSVH